LQARLDDFAAKVAENHDKLFPSSPPLSKHATVPTTPTGAHAERSLTELREAIQQAVRAHHEDIKNTAGMKLSLPHTLINRILAAVAPLVAELDSERFMNGIWKHEAELFEAERDSVAGQLAALTQERDALKAKADLCDRLAGALENYRHVRNEYDEAEGKLATAVLEADDDAIIVAARRRTDQAGHELREAWDFGTRVLAEWDNLTTRSHRDEQKEGV
jgi:hypothetical protein